MCNICCGRGRIGLLWRGCTTNDVWAVVRAYCEVSCVFGGMTCVCGLYLLVCFQCIVVLCEQPSISADIDDASQDELVLDDYRCLLSGSLAALNQRW